MFPIHLIMNLPAYFTHELILHFIKQFQVIFWERWWCWSLDSLSSSSCGRSSWRFHKLFQSLGNLFSSFKFLIFLLEGHFTFECFYLNLSDLILLLHVLFPCVQQLLNSLILQFIEVIPVLLQFPVQLHLLHFKFLNLLS